MKCVRCFVSVISTSIKLILSPVSFEASRAFCSSFVSRLTLADRDYPCMNL
jgi:hypothetical protein